VVATPIGNLGDVTLRALDVLRSVPLVAAEDTRLTRRLWARYGIETPLVSYHAHSGAGREGELIERLAGGDDVALVTDAGTPLVSDPGEGLVAAWTGRGGTVVPIPGASAVLAALVASGIPAPRWAFEGFLPRRGPERRSRLARIAADERATVLFESPARTGATVAELAEACGAERRAAVCREVTKRHEEILRGTARAGGPATLEAARARVETLVEGGLGRAEAARVVARETGLGRRLLYQGAGGRAR
jgi:16S rRNA (cytidine1402-2'-O)-methyltransferase